MPEFPDHLPDVVLFPQWNDKVTAAERLRELALIADKHPERFKKMFVGWIGERDGKDYDATKSLNMATTEIVAYLEMWKLDLLHETRSKV